MRGPEEDRGWTPGGQLTTTGGMTGRRRLGTTEVAGEAAVEVGEVEAVEEEEELVVVVEVGGLEALTTETETRREQKTLSEK